MKRHILVILGDIKGRDNGLLELVDLVVLVKELAPEAAANFQGWEPKGKRKCHWPRIIMGFSENFEISVSSADC